MVGPGTGVAPFRALLQYRKFRAANGLVVFFPQFISLGHAVGPNVLFFGCRYKSGDFLYYNEWEDSCRDKSLYIFRMYTLFQS